MKLKWWFPFAPIAGDPYGYRDQAARWLSMMSALLLTVILLIIQPWKRDNLA